MTSKQRKHRKYCYALVPLKSKPEFFPELVDRLSLLASMGLDMYLCPLNSPTMWGLYG